MRGVLAPYVERGEVPGLVALVARDGRENVHALGVKTLGKRGAIEHDTIFRISSMTKPITAAAAMMLIEEGKLRLDEPVDHLLPELAHPKVLNRLDGPLDEVVPAARAITVRVRGPEHQDDRHPTHVALVDGAVTATDLSRLLAPCE